ncbi:MAG: ATP-binding cassette domain-containing protein [Caldilineaceae bacterium]|nr:ATP-binding cassette domain-containing protein [Caldilineaceae bacterium]MDE0336314.1 ATP-binding cassette domain-containing protein [Caldilineaceae bacterium]
MAQADAVQNGANTPADSPSDQLPQELEDGRDPSGADNVLEVTDLRKYFPILRGFFRRQVGEVKAVDEVSFHVARGETLALVGESGCGKTTTGRCVMRAIEPSGGSVLFRKRDGEEIEITTLTKPDLRSVQQHMGMIFQDPFSSLNPRLTVLEIIGEPFVTRKLISSRRELEEKVAELLRSVRLDPTYMRRYPHAFSGGQRQRIAIARALALDPDFVVADEPVSALDVSVQAQILSLLKELQSELHLTYLFITHNLSVVEYLSDRVSVMYVGQIVELGRTDSIFRQPRHPYTEALLSAVPVVETGKAGLRRERIILEGDVADPSNVPAGCTFHPRCPYVQDICRDEEPQLVDLTGANGSQPHYVRCHFAEELELQGVRNSPQ